MGSIFIQGSSIVRLPSQKGKRTHRKPGEGRMAHSKFKTRLSLNSGKSRDQKSISMQITSCGSYILVSCSSRQKKKSCITPCKQRSPFMVLFYKEYCKISYPNSIYSINWKIMNCSLNLFSKASETIKWEGRLKGF